jgi:AcrR family transcriptional regulator
MARWQPDARGRLEAAALELFEADGYDGVTAARIAAHAGLTERTFFRHFTDKREVLFANQDGLDATLADAVRGAPAGLSLAETVGVGFRAMGERLEPRRDVLIRRARLIAAHPELQERELGKLAALSATLTAALRERGASAGVARVAGEAAVAVFRVAFERWTTGDRAFPAVAAEALRDLGTAFGPADGTTRPDGTDGTTVGDGPDG